MATDQQKNEVTIQQDREQGILNYSEAQERYDQLRADGYILFEAIVGSQSYGTALPTSDVDKKFVYIEPLERILNGTATQQLNLTKDYTGYEVGRYVELLSTNNPNILELLNSPQDCIILSTDAFTKHFIDNSKHFLSKGVQKSFGNYARTQIQKARGKNKKIVNPMTGPRKGLIDFCWVSHKQGSKPLLEILAKQIIPVAACGVSAIDHMKNFYQLHVDSHYSSLLDDAKKVYLDEEYKKQSRLDKLFGSRRSFEILHSSRHDKKIPQPLMIRFLEIAETFKSTKYKGITDKDDVQIVLSSIDKDQDCKLLFFCNVEGFQAYCKEYKEWQEWDKNKNQERFLNNMAVGAAYDTKNMMHCHRLLDTALEILATGEINVRRKNREELLSIRAGEMPYEQLLANAERKITLIQDAALHSALPDEVSKTFMRDLLLNIRKDIYFHNLKG